MYKPFTFVANVLGLSFVRLDVILKYWTKSASFILNVAHHFHNKHQRRTIAVLFFSYRACSIRTLLNNCVRCNETFQPANAAIFRPSLHQHIYFAVLHSAFCRAIDRRLCRTEKWKISSSWHYYTFSFKLCSIYISQMWNSTQGTDIW